MRSGSLGFGFSGLETCRWVSIGFVQFNSDLGGLGLRGFAFRGLVWRSGVHGLGASRGSGLRVYGFRLWESL